MANTRQNKVSTIPPGFTEVTPWIISSSTSDLIKFLVKVFGAEEINGSRIVNEQGVIIHAVIKIGTAHLLLFDSREGWGPTPSFLNLYVADLEAVYERALKEGASSVTDITSLWFGEKVCRIIDPFGNLWWLNQRVEEVDFTDPAIAARASTPEAKQKITYIQRSLNEAILQQQELLKK